MQSRNFSVTTTAQLIASGGMPSNPNRVIILNSSAGVVYAGGPAVTADTTAATGGFPIAVGGTLAVDLTGGDDLYLRAGSTLVVNVLQSNAA